MEKERSFEKIEGGFCSERGFLLTPPDCFRGSEGNLTKPPSILLVKGVHAGRKQKRYQEIANKCLSHFNQLESHEKWRFLGEGEKRNDLW
jgi:hypothetical protein